MSRTEQVIFEKRPKELQSWSFHMHKRLAVLKTEASNSLSGEGLKGYTMGHPSLVTCKIVAKETVFEH